MLRTQIEEPEMKNLTYAIALGIALATTPAAAGTEQFEIKVETADLDLSTQKDRNHLQARLKSAAKQACAIERTAGIRGVSRYRSRTRLSSSS